MIGKEEERRGGSYTLCFPQPLLFIPHFRVLLLLQGKSKEKLEIGSGLRKRKKRKQELAEMGEQLGEGI